jgi:excisionase family DNA binding protein
MSVRTAELDQFLTVGEIAERLKVNERTVRRWIKSHQLKAHKIGSCVRIALVDLHDFLERKRS